MLKLVALLLATAVAAPQSAAPFSAERRAGVEREAATVRDTLDLTLTDYSSARFRDVRALGKDGAAGVIFCGLVNAKNPLGAYVGWRRFAAMRTIIEVDDGQPFSSEEVDLLCDRPDLIADTQDWSAILTYQRD